MEESYGAAYARLYRTHWWWRARERYLAERLSEILRPGEAGEVLDFGCGDGLFFDALARFGEPSGVEPASALLDPAGRWRERISTAPLTFDANSTARYGLVVALDVFEHIQDPRPAIDELVRRTRPGGWWLVTVPAFRALWTRHDDLNQHVRRYRASELSALLGSAGLEIREVRYLFGWVAAAKLLMRVKEALVRGAPRAPQVPPSSLNALLYGLSRAEQRIFRRVPLPFGSTLMVLARVSRGGPPSP